MWHLYTKGVNIEEYHPHVSSHCLDTITTAHEVIFGGAGVEIIEGPENGPTSPVVRHIMRHEGLNGSWILDFEGLGYLLFVHSLVSPSIVIREPLSKVVLGEAKYSIGLSSLVDKSTVGHFSGNVDFGFLSISDLKFHQRNDQWYVGVDNEADFLQWKMTL